jgi:hypothetical protein
MGKRDTILFASCKYLEGLMGIIQCRSIRSLSDEYGISDTAIMQRHKEIMKLLNISPSVNFHKLHCEYCGKDISRNRKFKHNGNENQYICFECSRGLSKRISRRWEETSICIICGETNPLMLCPTGHHILGSENNDFTIPICENCHRLTMPRSRQGFFLFDNWKFPESRFTEDNSGIYVHYSNDEEDNIE